MKKLLIYDDLPELRGKVKALIERSVDATKAFDVVCLSDEQFHHSLDVLHTRHREFRGTGAWDHRRIDLDEAAVFVIDYDLFDAVPFLEADDLAYLVRCFSTCGLIIGYRYTDDSFDLTLRGDLHPFTDSYIGGQHLGNPGLWREGGLTETDFRPWYWPSLPDYLNRFERRVEDVKQSLVDSAPISRILAVPSNLLATLPRSISEFLGGDPAEITFGQFVRDSGNGLEPKDAKNVSGASISTLARVGAARISKWLEWSVLPEQDIVVDAPHLVQRFPSLLTGELGNIATWNGTAKLSKAEELGMKTDLIEPFRFLEEHWFSRPVWFWGSLREHEEIVEVREPWKFEKPNWVFCEDTSLFHDREDCREFVADVESPYKRRFVKYLDGIEYRPRVRFAL